MSFLEKPSTELLVELSEEQQQTLAGGTSNETQDTYYKKVEYTEENTNQGNNTDIPVFPLFFFWKPVVRVNSLN